MNFEIKVLDQFVNEEGSDQEKACWNKIKAAMCDSEHIAPVVRCCQNSEDILKETVENALYATGRFTTDQCTDLAEGIILYIKDSGLKISRQ